MQCRRRTEDPVRRKVVAAEVIRDHSSCFAGNDGTCGDVVLLEGEFLESVQPAGGNQTEIISCGSRPQN